MYYEDLKKRALEIRQKYAELELEKLGKTWSNMDQVQGFAVDVGYLQKIVMAKEGLREMENIDEKLAHELADCFYSLLVIADRYKINLEKSFMNTMDEIEKMQKNKGEEGLLRGIFSKIKKMI